MWDRFDFAGGPWQDNPYNPKNNVNYTAKESGLSEVITTHPGRRESAFFRSVPALEHNQLLLRYQHLQVDKHLSFSLRYDHVLYCMDNETNESPEWPKYWATFVRQRAREAGVSVELTEMWDDHDLLGAQHANTVDHPELYTFVDVSQNNHQSGFDHWAKAQEIRRRIQESGQPRPINNVKIYGANTGRYGTHRDAQERFWRNIVGGLASSRFHRPPSGLGLNEIAQAHLRSMRLFAAALDLFRSVPHQELLSGHSRNEAYCTAIPGEAYAVFFPDGGNVTLDVSAAAERALTVRWLDIRRCAWTGEPAPTAPTAGRLSLVTPAEDGYWAAVVQGGG
jgi:hypothetical protein